MKWQIVLSIVLSLCARSQSWATAVVQEIASGDPVTCKDDKEYKVGEKWYSCPEICAVHTCTLYDAPTPTTKVVLTTIGCLIPYKRPGCPEVSDLSKLYPDCCPKPVCNNKYNVGKNITKQ